jgi:hypothetical protein
MKFTLAAASMTALTMMPLAGVASETDVATYGNVGTNGPLTLTVNRDSDARQVIASVPASGALERFEMVDSQGHTIGYVALTETDVGALVFVDKKLRGTVSRRDAQAFYSCRGYASATLRHWAADATAWAAGLLDATKPASEVVLKFTGKSSYQSIKDVVDNPAVSEVRSLMDVGSNPLGIFRTLNQVREDSRERERHEQTLRALGTVAPGMGEDSVANIVRPEDVSFVAGGMVMAYPRYSVEFFVAEGKVQVAQQPSFHVVSRQQAALFYVPGMQWTNCTPQSWKSALKAGTP